MMMTKKSAEADRIAVAGGNSVHLSLFMTVLMLSFRKPEWRMEIIKGALPSW